MKRFLRLILSILQIGLEINSTVLLFSPWNDLRDTSRSSSIAELITLKTLGSRDSVILVDLYMIKLISLFKECLISGSVFDRFGSRRVLLACLSHRLRRSGSRTITRQEHLSIPALLKLIGDGQ